MALPYSPRTWVDNVTQATAAVMNSIEQALKDLSDAVTSLESGSSSSGFAPLDSAALTGNPTAPDPTLAQGIATKAYVDGRALTTYLNSSATDAGGSTDTVINSGVTDASLVPPVTANSTTVIDYTLAFSGDPTDDAKLQFLGPSGATVFGYVQAPGTGASNSAGTAIVHQLITGFSQVVVFGTYAAGVPVVVSLTVVTGATGGTVSFQYSRNSNTSGAAGAGTAVKRLAGSNCRAARIA